MESDPNCSVYNIANSDVAFDYFNKLLTTPDIEQIRFSTYDDGIKIATLAYRQYHLNTNRELYHSHLIFVRQESTDSSANIFNLSSRIGQKSEYVSISKNGSLLASLVDGDNGQFIAVGGTSRGIECAIELTHNDVMSRIYKPTKEFGAFEWSYDEKRIVLVVRPGKNPDIQRPENITFSYILNNDQYSDKTGPGEELSDIEAFKIAVLHISSACVSLLSIPDGYYPSQFTYDNNSDVFYFVGIKNDPYYSVGLLHCTNRPTKIFMAKCFISNDPEGLWTVAEILDGELHGKCYHSPRISPDSNKLVYTRNLSNGPHNHCREICTVKNPFRIISERVLVNIVEDSLGVHTQYPSTYIGLYEDLPENCWLSDSNFIVFSASNGFYKNMYRLTVSEDMEEYGHLVYIKPPKRLELNGNVDISGGCWTIKSVYKDQIMVTFSSCEISTEIFIGTIVNPIPVNNQIELSWLLILHGAPYFPHISMQGKLLSNPVEPPTTPGIHSDDDIFQGIFEQSFLITSTNMHKDAPTIIYVHGGPNTAFHDEFTQGHVTAYTFVASGFNVLELNYVGSLGYGQRSLRFLTGYVLDRDVDSCIRLINNACVRHNLNRKKLFFLGGSHSGGIGIHLMSRYPDLFLAAALRNPVCDYVTLLIGSDIPDYTFNQVLQRTFQMDFDFDNTLVDLLMQKNPLKLASTLITPLLLLLGSNDLRVPYRAALRLKEMLSSRDIPCKARVYPDGHAIKQIPHMQDSFVHTFEWFASFLSIFDDDDDDDIDVESENNNYYEDVDSEETVNDPDDDVDINNDQANDVLTID